MFYFDIVSLDIKIYFIVNGLDFWINEYIEWNLFWKGNFVNKKRNVLDIGRRNWSNKFWESELILMEYLLIVMNLEVGYL